MVDEGTWSCHLKKKKKDISPEGKPAQGDYNGYFQNI